MCGIVGYTGSKNCSSILFEGLSKLEYRGYDSAGITVIENSKAITIKAQGKLSNLKPELDKSGFTGTCGIGHTRWATHGKPSVENAHPHTSGRVTVVHNGIIENYVELKSHLISTGRIFSSETDTEIIAHLIDIGLSKGKTPLEAIAACTVSLKGTWALGILIDGYSDTLWAARNQSPLILGTSSGENFIASDIPAIMSLTNSVIFPEDNEIIEVSPDKISIFNEQLEEIRRTPQTILWNPVTAEKGGYKHFMLKEISEQPRALSDTIAGRITSEDLIYFDGIELPLNIKRVLIIACGTSYYAGLIGKYMIENTARIPVEVDFASEFRYRNPVLDANTLIISISQSGETADTLAAVKEARKSGAFTLSISNVINSQIPRVSSSSFYTHAGPEIGVASTKAFTCQLGALFMTAVHLGIKTGSLEQKEAIRLVGELRTIPSKMHSIIDQGAQIKVIARRYMSSTGFLYIARGLNYPIALEGALKLKEISYIHAEGYPAGEMKHGPIALIDENLPVVSIVPKNGYYQKVVSNLEEVRARGGKIIAIATRGDSEIADIATDLFQIPDTDPLLEPLLTVIPVQLLAYYISDFKGTDVDQPRNLAKSVTVE
ncbi:glutamine--fructose-6-phosphate transaminase (isomerizing) [Myxococcota bacterium]|nr:glutamine--fructose-6-phosphate transaminase (isomerizing) [Myxococcota bacterium]MBU1382019.1 glutamine--fructose-6-phosphate transaminase (isomerizing) [Myxococcota bacterium]MBU1495339.1 glutamine--fructose-6-phosphate transaminase (isomerizing) [Myxococcota bacterium]